MDKVIPILDRFSPVTSTNLIMYSLRKAVVPLLLSTQAIATGCDKALPVKAGSTTKISITSGGLDRDYLIHVPKTYDATKKVPLIFSFHGRGKNASSQLELSQFANPDFNPDAISVYPNGVKVSPISIFGAFAYVPIYINHKSRHPKSTPGHFQYDSIYNYKSCYNKIPLQTYI